MAKAKPGDIVTIKKYANRRLYNTESSSYVTLEHLSAMTREGRDFKVVDAKTGEDLTHTILTQIIMEEESRGTTMLPVNFLRQIIGFYGDPMQSMVRQYLEPSMDTLRRNQTQLREAITAPFANSPFAEIAKRNAELLSSAAGAFIPGANGAKPPQPAGQDRDKELAELRAQMAALQQKLDRLAG